MPVFEKNVTPTGSISLEMRDTSGAFVAGTPTVTVSKDGGAYASGAGTLAGLSGGTGEWEYLPTSGETNCGKFKVKAVLMGAVTVTREVLPEVAYTATRAGYVDTLNGLVAAIWGFAGRTLATFGDSSGITTLLGRLTAGRATGLDNLDATVSSRSVYAGGDTSGTGTLLARLTAGRATAIDNLDTTVSSRLATSGYTTPPNDTAIRTDVQAAMTSQGYTTTRAGYLDALNGLVAAIWGYATRTLSAFSFNVTLSPTATALDGIQPNAAFFANSPSGTDGGTTLVVSIPALLPGYAIPAGDLLPIRRGDAWSAQITGLGTLTGRTKLWATFKRDVRRTDAQADAQIVETTGLIVLAGYAPISGQTGTAVVADATTGIMTLSMSGAATAQLGPGDLDFDVQALFVGGPKTLVSGKVAVVADVTRAVA